MRVLVEAAGFHVERIHAFARNLTPFPAVFDSVVSVFQKTDAAAHIAAHKGRKVGQRFVACHHIGVFFAVEGGEGAGERRHHFGGGDGLELKQGRARNNGVINIEMRVFGGGGDQGYAPVLHVFQQALLLLSVEILNFVQIQQDSARAEHVGGLGKDGFDIRERGGSAVETAEHHAGLLGDDGGGGGFPRAGGAEEDHIGAPAAFHHPAHHAACAEQMRLTHQIVKRGGAQEVC